MTETQTGQATGQSANGAAPAPPPEGPPEVDTGERVLGALMITAGLFLMFIGIDRATGGALTARFYPDDSDAGG